MAGASFLTLLPMNECKASRKRESRRKQCRSNGKLSHRHSTCERGGSTESFVLIQKFQEVSCANPGSVLRYASGTGKGPLWGRCSPVPESIPPCPRCGAYRRFEFQLLPQLLAFLDIDNESPTAPDWCASITYYRFSTLGNAEC